MRKIAIITLLLLSMLIPFTAAANGFRSTMRSALASLLGTGYVPTCAENIAAEMDRQLSELLGEHYSRKDLRIVLTVPVNINDFEKTNALSRQVAEEVGNALKAYGYRVLDIRKAKTIEMTPKKGEFHLSRDKCEILNLPVNVELVLTGTYTITDKSVRYNCRLLHAGSQEIIAAGNGTVPVYAEILPLIEENYEEKQEKIRQLELAPSVKTKL